jgi:hypothetical protein
MEMLEKINNISTKSDYSKAVRTSNFGAILGSTYTRKVDSHDSVDISPAFKFMNSVNWKLKEFKHVVDEKLLLGFILSEIEFHTTIDLVNLEKISLINYSVIKENKKDNPSRKIITDLSVKVNRINYSQDPVLINFSSLNVFFQRIFNLNIYREISREEKYFFDDLLEGIFFGIQEEFIHLNSHVLIFLDKLTGQRVGKKESSQKDYGETVVIKKFKVINVE